MHMNKIETVKGSTFPGFLISNSIAAFVIVTGIVTAFVALIIYPMFWRVLWSYKYFIIPILVSMVLNNVIDNYLEDFVYERYYCKHRHWAGFLDLAHFFLSILSGFGSALSRFLNGVIALLVAQSRMNQPCLPNWMLDISYFDAFHKSYMSFIYWQHAHDNPVASYWVNTMIQTLYKRKLKAFNEHKSAFDNEMIPHESETHYRPNHDENHKQTIFQKARNKIMVGMMIKKNPILAQYTKEAIKEAKDKQEERERLLGT